MRPRYNGLAISYMYWSVLLVAVALALSVLTVLWSTLPVQAQSESTDNDTSATPGEEQPTDTGDTSGSPRPTGKHIVAFSNNTISPDYEKRISDLGGRIEDKHDEIGVVVASGLSEEAAGRLESDEDVEVVEPDMEIQWLDPVENASVEVSADEGDSAEVSADEEGSAETAAEADSTDAPQSALNYARQWNMREAIKADTAWKAGRLGSPNVTVAILDTGIGEFRCTRVSDRTGRCTNEATHPDLTNRVDRVKSRSFVPSENELVKQAFPGTPEWTDLHFHGTHVAATVSSNASLNAGVTSKVNLMAVKVLNRFGAGATSSILDGLMYAADNGADVINMSLGGSFTKKPDDLDKAPPGFVSVINRAINHANEKGSTIVVSAGNDNRDLKADSNVYQAYCQSPHVICASATGPTSTKGTNGPWTDIDAKASYSNFGPPIVVAAPGGNTGGSVFAACSKTSGYVNAQEKIDFRPCQAVNTSIGLKGTSQAAPHVSGLAALLVEDIGKGHPSEVAARIRKSADDLGRQGNDEVYGQGRINVAKALGLQETNTPRKPRK
jgi:hypothetical protein